MATITLRKRSDDPANSHLAKNPHITGDEPFFESPRGDWFVNYPMLVAIGVVTLGDNGKLPSTLDGLKSLAKATLADYGRIGTLDRAKKYAAKHTPAAEAWVKATLPQIIPPVPAKPAPAPAKPAPASKANA